MKISDNKLAQSCFSFACSDANSIIGNKIAHFRSEYNISVETLSVRELTSLRDQLNFVRSYNLLSITSGHIYIYTSKNYQYNKVYNYRYNTL